MTVYLDVQKALESRLYSAPVDLPIAWQNVNYVPTQGVSYLRSTVLWAPASLLAMNGQQTTVGVYQVDVYVAADKGPKELNETLSTLHSHFKEDMTLTNTSTSVYIREVSVSQPTRQDAFYVASLSINFRFYSS